jgi:SAM-dependent methyltransferase
MAFNYKKYVTDEKFLKDYENYQERYSSSVRESDKKTIDLIGDWIDEGKKKSRVLDIGCSTGNLLYHLHHVYPDLELVGCDYAETSIRKCSQNTRLKNIEFHIADVTNPIKLGLFDIVLVNAVFYMMSENDFAKGLLNISKTLKQGGLLILFDFANDFNQDLKITEVSKSHPSGLDIHFRPKEKIRELLLSTGFSKLKFMNFKLPIDLPLISEQDHNELNSYTIKSENGERLVFRGSLYQPWCHICARR